MLSGMDLEFDREAAAAKRALDAVNPRTADRVDDWLDRLEADHTSADVRRQRLHRPALWLIRVRPPNGDDYAILWDLDGEQPVVRYIGPDVFN
jgi:hypothetical protein